MPLNVNEVDFSSKFQEKQFCKTLFVTQNKQYFDFKLNTYNQITNARESNKKYHVCGAAFYPEFSFK